MDQLISDFTRLIGNADISLLAALGVAFALMFWWGLRAGSAFDAAPKVWFLVLCGLLFIMSADSNNSFFTMLALPGVVGFVWAIAAPLRRRRSSTISKRQAKRQQKRDEKLAHHRALQLAQANSGTPPKTSKTFLRAGVVILLRAVAIAFVFVATNAFFGHGTMQLTPEGILAASFIGLITQGMS